MVEHELRSDNSREIVCAALEEAGLKNVPTINIICLRSFLLLHYGGTVWTETNDDGLVEIVASAPFSNFVLPKTETERDKFLAAQKFARALEAKLGHSIHRDFPDQKNQRAITRIKLTQDLAYRC